MRADSNPTSLYTAAQVRQIDGRAIAHAGVSAFELMQRAGNAAFSALRARWPDARHIALLAGSGNNGGDAFVLGALALHAGFKVDALALGAQSSGAAAQARVAFERAGGTIQIADGRSEIGAADVIVDGLFGTGLTRAASGVAAHLIERANTARCAVLALDVPSGLDADTGQCLGRAIDADATISFIAWKRGLFTADASDQCGALELATLEVPETAYTDILADAHLLDACAAEVLGRRRNNSNKSTFGHVLIVGGDHGMAGAVQISGRAALRCGAGLVSIATRGANVSALNAARPELMAHAVEGRGELEPLIENASVLAIGPGLGQGAWGRALFDAAIARERALVLDADALNLLAAAPRALPPEAILTPHPGEAARLLDCDIAAIQRDRFAAVRALAARYGAVVVLKGAGSLVGATNGEVAVCRHGNPGMASGGMGDLLTGVVAALRAQGLSAWDAACLATDVHARAGDRAAADAPRGLIASDLLLPLRELVNGMAR